MLNIYLNNEKITIAQNVSLFDLLTLKNLLNEYSAVAINKIFVPRHQYAQTTLNENDVIEIILPMQGG